VTGLVYFVQAEAVDNLIKIGATRDFGARFAALCSYNACDLTVLGIIRAPQPSQLERVLHARFAVCRHHGEWFKPKRELLRYIEKHATAPKTPYMPIATPQQWSLDALLAPDQETTPVDEVLTIRDVAKLLHVQLVTVRRYVDRRLIPCVRVGRQLRFTRQEVLQSQPARALDLSR
jgi:excisionase family DNA binding protein